MFTARLEPPAEQPITARLAGAGAMRAEIELVLAAVPAEASASDYRHAILEDNATRKGSHTGRMWSWMRLKLRYALDRPGTIEFRAFRRAMADPDPAGRWLAVMLMLARTDRLFRDVTLAILVPRMDRIGDVVSLAEVRDDVVARMLASNLSWSRQSISSTANHLLSSWKDIGLIQGSKVRRVARVDTRTAVIRFAVELAKAEGCTDLKVLESTWFLLLGMGQDAADAALRAAARDGILRYRAQAGVVEIDLGEGH